MGQAPRRARPRDAATLVVVRAHGSGTQVLMGRRPEHDRFMPGVWVFPGGRVDRGDARRACATELRPDVRARLERSATASRARALAVAAVRETFEETGLRVAAAPSADDAGALRPALDRLRYLGRAITPPGSPIRYHARFLLAEADAAHGELRSNGELLDLAWIPIERALRLPIIDVTAVLLEEVAAHAAGTHRGTTPFIRYRRADRRIVTYE